MRSIKFILATVAVLAFVSFNSDARKKENLRIGISGYPLNAASMFEDGYIIGTKDISFWPGNTTIKDIYSDVEGNTYSTGTITFEYGIRMDGGYEVSLNAGFDLFWQEFKSPNTGKKTSSEKGLALYCIPMFRFYFLEREHINFYTGAGIGFTFYCGFDEVEFPVRPSVQWTPFGFEAGKDLFLFGELGLGTMFNGGRIGLGYRF